jgi:hypothetical protein
LLAPFSIVLVLSAAFMHASWNALLRGGADRAQTMLVINVTIGTAGVAMVAFAGLPSSASAHVSVLPVGAAVVLRIAACCVIAAGAICVGWRF